MCPTALRCQAAVATLRCATVPPQRCTAERVWLLPPRQRMRPHCVRWGSARRRVGQSVRGSSAAAVAQRSRPALPPTWLQPAQCGRPCGSSRASARAAQRAARQRRSTRRAEGACRFQRKISAAVVAVQRSATDQHGARVRALMQCSSAAVQQTAGQRGTARPAGARRIGATAKPLQPVALGRPI